MMPTLIVAVCKCRLLSIDGTPVSEILRQESDRLALKSRNELIRQAAYARAAVRAAVAAPRNTIHHF